MPNRARIYIASIIALGTAILIGCVSLDPHFPDLTRFLQLMALAILASTFKIRLPGMEGTISLTFMIYLVCIGALTLTETVLMASVATLVQALWRPKTRPAAMKVMFNVSALVISVTCSYLASRQVYLAETQVPALVIAATVLFVVNSWLVSLVVALTSGGSVRGTWRNCNRWTFMYYLMGAGVAVLVIAYSRVVGWEQALALLPVGYLIYAYCDGRTAQEYELHA